jgi:hypothetical protein
LGRSVCGYKLGVYTEKRLLSGWAEELVMQVEFVVCEFGEVLADVMHECWWSDKVDVGVALELVHDGLEVVLVKTLVDGVGGQLSALVGDKALVMEVWLLVHLLEELSKRLVGGVAVALDECHVAAGGNRLWRHGHQWRHADTGTDHNHRVRGVLLVQDKLAIWWGDLDGVSLLNLVVEELGDQSAWDSLDGDSIERLVLHELVRDGVLSSVYISGLHREFKAQVLAWLWCQNWLTVHRLQVEGNDIFCLRHLLGHAEVAVASPTTVCLFVCVVNVALGLNKDVRKSLVGGAPRSNYVIVGHVLTKDLDKGVQQILADNWIVLWKHVQRAVLLNDALNKASEGFKVLNVLSVGQQSTGKRLWLSKVLLVGRVEEGSNSLIFVQHSRVEMLGDLVTTGLQNGNSGLNDG